LFGLFFDISEIKFIHSLIQSFFIQMQMCFIKCSLP